MKMRVFRRCALKKRVIILLVLASFLVAAGFAAACGYERVYPTNILLDNNFMDFENISCPFAKAADDGGALEEKAKCRAMLQKKENDQPEAWWAVDPATVQDYPTARLACWASLAAIREDEV